MHRSLRNLAAGAALAALGLAVQGASPARPYDIVLRGGTVYDGSGQSGRVEDVAIKGDRIAAIAPHVEGRGKTEIDVRGKAVAPGFINMLAHPEESLLADGRALSDLSQGVTLEVMGEDSMGPLTPQMKALMVQRQGDIKFPVTWTTLGGYMEGLQKRGISPNVAAFVGEGVVRTNLLGENDVAPTPEQLKKMESLVRQAMEEGALGLTTALIYAPNTYAKTPELIDLAKVSARCGGMYIAHIRNESSQLLPAIQETIDIAQASGAPAEIYHFKQAGKENWDKFAPAVAMIEAARARGVRISADMYVYTAGATGLDAAMPPWVQNGGLEKWVERLKEPAIRAKVAGEMRDPVPKYENLLHGSGPDGVLFLNFKTERLKPLIGKTLGEVARERGKSPEETAMDLVVEDGTRVEVAYFVINEDNIRKEVKLPWMSFGSDEAAPAPEGVFLKGANHPRAYGNFARLLGHYVRDDHDLSLPAAIHQLTGLPAHNLSLKRRGELRPGYYADVVVFDPATIADKSTYPKPHQLATGVEEVIVNGGFAIEGGKPTAAPTGRFVRGRAWTGAPGGGCKAHAGDWGWSK
jgi:N-acyl-D-amino-acid deacylase